MSYVIIWVHAVWGTKNRYPYLTEHVRPHVIRHILENCGKKKIQPDSLDGYHDHLHCLFRLNPDMSIAKAMQLIKGESSHWVNNHGILQSRFEWADDYYAVSVSESQVPRVRNYILRQAEHHGTVSFKERFEAFHSSIFGLNDLPG